MSTNLGQQLIERGREQGLEQGLEQGRQRERAQAVLDVLAYRFGTLPASIGERLARIDDLQRLRDLSGTAVTADSLEEFARALE